MKGFKISFNIIGSPKRLHKPGTEWQMPECGLQFAVNTV